MLKIIFAGTPECATPALEAIAKRHRVVGVLTNPPASQGRHRELVPSPVMQAAQKLIDNGTLPPHTPIFAPEKITDEVRSAIAETEADLMVCFAFGKIFGPKTLSLFPLGSINIHPSLLPRWRGCAPVPAAILARDAETGITIQKIVREMDAGDILAQVRFPLDGTETADSLLERAARDSAPLVLEVLDAIENGTAQATPQDSSQATYSALLCKEDGEIDWTASAEDIDAKIRAFTSWPGAWTRKGEQILMILEAAVWKGTQEQAFIAAEGSGGLQKTAHPDTPAFAPGTVIGTDKRNGILVAAGTGTLALKKLQWRTKKPLDWKSFLNGSRDFPGSVLGGEPKTETEG